MNVGLAGLVEKGKFIGPEIRVIAFHVGIIPDMARPRRRQRQEIGAKRAFVGGAIGPKGPPCPPIGPQAFLVAPRRGKMRRGAAKAEAKSFTQSEINCSAEIQPP